VKAAASRLLNTSDLRVRMHHHERAQIVFGCFCLARFALFLSVLFALIVAAPGTMPRRNQIDPATRPSCAEASACSAPTVTLTMCTPASCSTRWNEGVKRALP
jgi:hypothetical protein